VALVLFVCMIGAGSLVFALAASGGARDKGGDGGRGGGGGGDGGGGSLIRASFAPSKTTDPAFHAVRPGGADWFLDEGSVRLNRDGDIEVELQGLVLANGTAGGVVTVSASLLCGADAVAGPAATTGTFPLSQAGDAEFETSLTVPATCLAPIVVINPNGRATTYIAVTGWRP